MRAIVLEAPGKLAERDLPEPEPGPGEVVVAVRTCGVCRTDLHIHDGELAEPSLPLVLGHQIVGEVIETGAGSERFAAGDPVGIGWLAWACGECRYCRSARENLCERALFTGYTRPGGYAELVLADERFCLALPVGSDPVVTAPLLCAGSIGHRALRMCGDAPRLGLYGFGSSAHIVCQLAAREGRRVFAITRPGDTAKQEFARELGAEWAGDAEELPEPLDAAIIFAPVGELVPVALGALAPGGTVVCAGIHMSEIPAFAYDLLWGERQIRSVANLTRHDGEQLIGLVGDEPVRVETVGYPLGAAEDALADLRGGRVRGGAVLEI